MKTLKNNKTTSEEDALAALLNAKERNRSYWPLFSTTKQQIATDLKALCQAAYFESRIYINARDKFIAVKVENPRASAAWLYPTEYAALQAYTTKIGVEAVMTKTGLIYHILK